MSSLILAALKWAAVAAATLNDQLPFALGQYHQATEPAVLDRSFGQVPLPSGAGAQLNADLPENKSPDRGATLLFPVSATATPAMHPTITGSRPRIARRAAPRTFDRSPRRATREPEWPHHPGETLAVFMPEMVAADVDARCRTGGRSAVGARWPFVDLLLVGGAGFEPATSTV